MDDNERYYKLDEYLDKKKLKDVKYGNKELILGYDKQAKLDRKTIATTATNKQKLIVLFYKYIKKRWKDVTKKDMEKVIADINNNNKYSEKTKSNYKKMFKQLDKWHNNGKCSERTEWINTTPIKRKLNGLQRSDLLTDEDKKKLIRATDNKRDKAIISIWLETGMRPKELRTLTIGSITMEKDLAFIQVASDTKTGPRPVPVYFSKPALIDYLNEHPAKDDEKAPLWVKLKKSRQEGYQKEIEPMNKYGYDEILNKIAKRAKINKRIYWYLGRHNSYTDKVSQGWNEGILKQFHGIEPGSSVLNRYVHLSGKDVATKVKEYYGLDIGTVRKPALTITKCVNCNEDNPTSNVRCSKCGYIIDTKVMAEELERRKKIEQRKDTATAELKERMKKIEEALLKLGMMEVSKKLQ